VIAVHGLSPASAPASRDSGRTALPVRTQRLAFSEPTDNIFICKSGVTGTITGHRACQQALQTDPHHDQACCVLAIDQPSLSPKGQNGRQFLATLAASQGSSFGSFDPRCDGESRGKPRPAACPRSNARRTIAPARKSSRNDRLTIVRCRGYSRRANLHHYGSPSRAPNPLIKSVDLHRDPARL
jgi:hypothetical protein